MIKKIISIVFILLIIGAGLGMNKVFLGNLKTVVVPIEKTKNGKTVVDMGKVLEATSSSFGKVQKITSSKEVSKVMNILNSKSSTKDTKDIKSTKGSTVQIDVDKAIEVIKSINEIDAKVEIKDNELIIKYKPSKKGVISW